MTLHFENESETDLGFDPEKLSAEVMEGALDYLECPYEADISLLLTQSSQIREMNLQFRGIDAATDVLSFPMNEFPREGDFSFLEQEEAEDCFHPETGELLLGDIVINTDRVLSQAEEYGHSPRREFAFLMTHSILHLCGFDHMEKAEEERMNNVQEEILSSLGITRDL